LQKLIAFAAFLALFLFNAPFPLVVLGAGAVGMAAAAFRPGWLALGTSTQAGPAGPRPWRHTLQTIPIWCAVWVAPMLVILAMLGPDHVLWKLGVFFSKLAVVTFGGAYAVLAYMAQAAVEQHGWLSAGEMADGLGLAETTPGPLILVTQFVGFLAGFREPEPFVPLLGGVMGAALTTWVTFAPCFLWIFTFAPWIERLQNAQRLKGGLSALTAAVVGVIANLAIWFAFHVLFTRQVEMAAGPLSLLLPDPGTFDLRAGLLAIGAAIGVFRLRANVMLLLPAAAGAGLLLGQMTVP